MLNLKRKHYCLILALIVITYFGNVILGASKVKIYASLRSRSGPQSTGNPEEGYRQISFVNYTRIIYEQWFKQKKTIIRAVCIPFDQANTFIKGGTGTISAKPGFVNVHFTVESNTQNCNKIIKRTKVRLLYNFNNKTVMCENSGESINFNTEQVYFVWLDKNHKVL